MNGPAHLAAGLCSGVGAAAVAGAPVTGALAAAAGGLAASKLPDIDREGDSSYNHRSLTHSAALAVPALVVAAYLLPYEQIPGALAMVARLAALGFIAGYASHLLLDAVTIKRIPLFTKHGPKIGISVVNTNKASGMAIQLAVIVVCPVLALIIFANVWGGLGSG